MDRPSDLIDGTLKGCCNVLAGVGMGLGSIVVAPVHGAYEGGVFGFVTGALLGSIGAVVFVTAGAGSGAVQLVRGVVATPEAIDALITGKEWDTKAERWIFYSLDEEAKLVLNMGFNTYVMYTAPHMAARLKLEDDSKAGSGGSDPSSPKRAVKDSRLYDVLGVQTDAGSSEIKKAYYTLARRYHPDKNGGDKVAKERFQEISNAYQVLSDDQSRAKYDRLGQDAVKAPKMDAKDFYMLMFGSEDFEPLIGKMFITTMLGMEVDDFVGPPGLDPDTAKQMNMQLAKWKREVECAIHLKELVQPYVSGELDEARFRERIHELGQKLGTNLVGCALLGVVGYCYQHEASQALGYSNVSGTLCERCYASSCRFYNMGHVLSTYSSAVSSFAAGAQSAYEMSQQQDGQASLGAEHAQRFSRLLWNVCVIEIEDLLTQVVFKVTHDTSVPKEVRARRAQAIYIAGDVFRKFDVCPEQGLKELTAKITCGQ